jgi:hypothetical protein
VVVSLQYNGGPVVSSPENTEQFTWDAENGRLKELDQSVQIGQGKAQQDTEGSFDAEKNTTTITVHGSRPEVKIIKPGLVLLRTATNKGRLTIEF